MSPYCPEPHELSVLPWMYLHNFLCFQTVFHNAQSNTKSHL
ncbi:unnamed protein product, partial [Staurois parvus]